MTYRGDIDGLRAVAVGCVVLSHAGLSLPGGFVGVDVFFVISGFLITRMIAGDVETSSFSLLGFYERRARRILPALFVVMATTLMAGLILLLPADLAQLGASAVATAALLSNVVFWMHLDYFAPAAEYSPLLHTWSLGVEEQFYIGFPLLLLALMKLRRRAPGAVIALLCVVSLGASQVLLKDHASFSFFMLPTRGWELGLGALLALGALPAISGRLAREIAAFAGLAMILAATAVYSAATPFPGIAALMPCLGALLLIHTGEGSPTLAGRVLSAPPLVFIGLISYSLYLWHWPVLSFLRIRLFSSDLPLPAAAAGIGASLLLAVLSWRFVETPFRARTTTSRRTVLGLSAAATVAAVAAGLGLYLSQGLPGRLDSRSATLAAALQDLHPRRGTCHARPLNDLCGLGAPGDPTVLVWGDSHAASLMGAVEIAGRSAGESALISWRGRCPPLLGVKRRGEEGAAECLRQNQRLAEWLRRDGAAIETVVLAGRWAASATGERMPGEGLEPIRLANADGTPGANPELFRAGIRATLEAIVPGRRVIILGDVPEIGWDVPRSLASASWWGTPPPHVPSPDEVAARQAPGDRILEEEAAAAGAEFVPLVPLFCDSECAVSSGGRPLYGDGHHLSSAGGALVADRLREVLWPAAADGSGRPLRPGTAAGTAMDAPARRL